MIPLEDSEIKQLARSLRRIHQPTRSSASTGTTKIWYQGNEPYFDLTVEVKTDGEIAALLLTLKGYFLAWNCQNRKFSTGCTSETDIPGVSYYAASTVMNQFNEVNVTVLQQLQSLLLAIPPADPIIQQVQQLVISSNSDTESKSK
ncbi:MAG: hypothetical protein ACTS2F_04325 [Thainema sp.]